MLYFAESQLYWECNHCRLSEDNSPQAHANRKYPVLTFSSALTVEDTAAKWYEGAVQTYSKRKLTYQSDKLTAISAVAKATHPNRHVAYIAGLWEDSMVKGLGWYRGGPGKRTDEFPALRGHGLVNSQASCMTWEVRVTSGRITLRTMVATGLVMPGRDESSTDNYFKQYDDRNVLLISEGTGLEEWGGLGRVGR
ncbi:hypothetical protein OPT61_g10084 [Boeremia exigua]|uniref:Uncharacterized protein n=1 Tax=Boeremia exigua TaxID=749465 RepID=A0ACC2HSU4_9PLEO|nr:hypothetical protein OPT61_g10084 [Boeremia exigua]